MKNIVTKTIFILMLLIILISINTQTLAWSPIKDMGDDFIKTGEQGETSTVDEVGLNNLSSYVYNILLAAGVIIAVVVATVLGIQFMVGGAEGQAKVKEMLVPFVVGCIVVFGGFGFWKIALTVGEKIEDAGSYTQTVRCSRCGSLINPGTMDGQNICPSCGNRW